VFVRDLPPAARLSEYRAAIKTRMRVNQDENAAGGVMAGFAPSGVTIGGTTP
jgi:hypothetical protein